MYQEVDVPLIINSNNTVMNDNVDYSHSNFVLSWCRVLVRNSKKDYFQ